MQSSRDTSSEIRQQLRIFNEKIERRVEALFKEGLFTSNDKAKLEHLAQAIASALSRAMTHSYTSVVEEELLTNLAKDYEKNVLSLLQEVELRRYSDNYLSLRVDRIIQTIMFEQKLSKMTKDTESQVKHLEKQLWNDIRGISKHVSRRSQLIDFLLRDFEADIQSLLRTRVGSKDGDE